jgi:hypothetical protein
MNLHKHFWKGVFIVLLLIVISLLIYFVIDIKNLYQTGTFRPTRGFNINHISKQTANPNQIEGWMTFSYVNYLFNLPTNYLLETLNIQDSRYPNMGINKYVKVKGLDAIVFLTNVRASVAQFKNTP